MRILFVNLLLVFVYTTTIAQFAPPASQAGTTAIYKDSSIFVDWATACIVTRGLQDISDSSLGHASAGDSSMAIGKSGNGIVSLGDGGSAILTFNNPITNGPGWDFAVFENSFSDDFLELAFVEVSSDGINYFRFPSTSLTQTSVQTGSFEFLDATKINNLAGKYRAGYGTPFDLEEMRTIQGLDVGHITHIKIIDVIGNIQDAYVTYDSQNNKINDPWPTAFPTGGFDLDAIGVLHQQPSGMKNIFNPNSISVAPNPAKDQLMINSVKPVSVFNIFNLQGKLVFSSPENKIDCSTWPNGIYMVQCLLEDQQVITQKISIQHE